MGPLSPQHKQGCGLLSGVMVTGCRQLCWRAARPILLSLCDVTLGLLFFHTGLWLPRLLWPWDSWSPKREGSLVTLISPGVTGGPAMPLLKDAMPLMKEPHPPLQAPLPWVLPSLFAAFNVVLLVIFSGLFFAFP